MLSSARPKNVMVAGGVLLVSLASACGEPDLLVGEIDCSPHGLGTSRDPVADTWSTSFESGFCEYVARESGHCYKGDDASYDIVTSPTHSGRRAAAFTLDTAAPDGDQTRCFREGEFPQDARYGAWFYLPAADTVGTKNWNLVHVQTDRRSDIDAGHLWDISLKDTDDGELTLVVRDFLSGNIGGVIKTPPEPIPVPIAKWFHVEFRWLRAADETGIMALYQDGQLLWRETNRITDDSNWAQWYVGNLADSLPPEASTIYVDDVTLRPSP